MELDPEAILSRATKLAERHPWSLLSDAARPAERFGDDAYFAAPCLRSGTVAPQLPHEVGAAGCWSIAAPTLLKRELTQQETEQAR